MEKQRKYKILSIVALVVAICGMSLGFAAFSKVLTITAKATVTPNEEDIKLTLYGADDLEDMTYIGNNGTDFSILSKEKAYPGFTDGYNEYMDKNSYASIDNDNLSINIEKMEIIEPREYFFYFFLHNESEHNVYISFDKHDGNYQYHNNIFKFPPTSCTATDETGQNIADNLCDVIVSDLAVGDSNYNGIGELLESGEYMLESNQFITLVFSVLYASNDLVIDSPINVNFQPIKLNFSTTSTVE